MRLLAGIPADLAWRLVDAPAAARQLYGPAPWVPLTRWTLALTGVVAMLAGGGLAIVTLPALAGQVRPDLWPGWGPVGFAIGSAVVLAGVLGSVFWPRLGALVIVIIPIGLGLRPNLGVQYQQVITGVVLLAAAAVDALSRKRAQRT